jgi:CheY-like chemotaxis protein
VINFGAIRLQELLSRIEEAAKTCNEESLPDLAGMALEEYDRVKGKLETLARESDMKKVAVVEDNPDNRLLVSAILKGHYEIQEYETGGDALQGFAYDPPHLVLLDISLPGIDGIEVLKRIRADETLKEKPVIALTAHAMGGDREKHLAQGFDAYITKPILDDEAFLSIIAQHLDRKT